MAAHVASMLSYAMNASVVPSGDQFGSSDCVHGFVQSKTRSACVPSARDVQMSRVLSLGAAEPGASLASSVAKANREPSGLQSGWTCQPLGGSGTPGVAQWSPEPSGRTRRMPAPPGIGPS